jgi:amino acid adenylation domain-containing protein
LRRRLGEVLAHTWDRSPFYRELYAAHGIRQRDLSHVALEDLPVVSKADLMVRFHEAVTDPRLRGGAMERWALQDTDPLNLYLDEYIIVYSSGGSKIKSYVPYTRETWRYMTATAAPLLLPLGQGMDAPLRSAFFFKTGGHFAGATNASLASHSAHEVLRLCVLDPVEEVCARLNAFQPQRLHSYASAITWLAEWTLQGKLRIAPRTVLATADRLTPAMRAQVKEVWNADIYDLYAAAESLYMAVRRPADEEFQVFTDLNLLEVVDPANRMVRPGTRGRVLLTSLINTTLPLIRFDLHDYAVLGRAGVGAETLGRLDGKADALPVRLADGSVGVLEVYELEQIELPGVGKMQFVSHSPVEVEIRYQSSQDLDAQIDSAFRRLLARKSATVEKVAVRRVERILNNKVASKLRRVIKPDEAMITPAFLAEDDWHAPARDAAAGADVAPSFSAADPAGSVDQRFGQIVARYPEHPAALDGDHQLTYGQLDRLAAQVAGELLHRGFDATRPVAVFCAHQFELLPLILGIVRAGGFHLPLDPYLPAGRLQAILAETRPQLLLTLVGQQKEAQALAGDSINVLCLEQMDAPLPKQAPLGSPDDPACLLYTSGSTGAPKGVLLSHKTIRERAARYAADCDLGPGDRIALLQSYAVSAGIREIFGALLSRATLAFFDVRARGLAGLARWLNDTHITVLYAVPTLFRSFLETLTEETFPAVRIVRLGGEPPQSDDVSGFRRHFPLRCRLVNAYAASETDTICQYFMDHDTRIVAGRVPAGRPVAGVDVTLRDEQGNAAVDAVGEIRVAGKMLAAGYWDALNGHVQPFDLPFATGDLGYRLPDGRIFLLGRRDLIVKIHGYRIHLAEIERAVSSAPGIVEAAAVVRPAPLGNTTIVVYYVAAGGNGGPGPAALRRAVSSVVPAPAVGMAFVQLPALPRLPGGKVNRSNLPAQQGSAAAPSAGDPGYASATEAALAHIWGEALSVPAMGRGADFFELGGDSIRVFRVLAQIKKQFGVDLPVREFFAHSVLAELARAIDARRAR